MISEHSIELVKSNIDIVDTISNYIELKKNGTNYKARCPFHGEKTPSFVVSSVKQIYHCFGCGVSGDAIKFIMEHDKLTYIETIEKLASDYNITLEYTKTKTVNIDFSILDSVNNYYKKSLHKNDEILKYLSSRGVFESSIEKFDIGYADANNDFLNFLKSLNIDFQEALKVGILGKGDSGDYYAVFRQRIIFPIYSLKNKVVGFGGRTTIEHNSKYVNSPQSMVFNKSRLLYGYSQARNNIIQSDKVIIAEGYLDVVLLHQAGFCNCVATLGTAMTKEHIPIISRLTKNVLLAYDGDKAGKNAAYKAMRLIQDSSLKGNVCLFDDGVDPADLVASGDIQKLQDIFSNSKNGIEYIFEFIVDKYDLDVSSQKQTAFDECIGFFNTLSNVMQYEYKSFLANLLKLDDKIIPIYRQKQTKRVIIENEDTAELSVLKTMVQNPILIDDVIEYIEYDMFVYHKREFLSIIKDVNSKEALEVSLRDEIECLNDEHFFKQITILMSRFYQSLRKRKLKENLSLSEKSYIMRKIEENIKILKTNTFPTFDENITQYFH
ncbi:DNA primase [hydrothermal vent metagenome]|uniref:DNA primase n=1 Tax=hydrothermal vent metagenome TaxID=652676 RepID=A0A3B1E918_9ZZZZ